MSLDLGKGTKIIGRIGFFDLMSKVLQEYSRIMINADYYYFCYMVLLQKSTLLIVFQYVVFPRKSMDEMSGILSLSDRY